MRHPGRTSSPLRPGISFRYTQPPALWREALQILSGGAGASHREIVEKLAGMVFSQYDGAGSRPGRLWRCVMPYGRRSGQLLAPARELSQV
jgi:hypothetical protein